jgi:hypothetical protein
MRFILALFLTASLVCRAALATDRQGNAVFEELIQNGIAIGDKTVKLPEPSLSPDADPKEQAEVVRQIATKKYEYDQFVRKSPVAPFALEINTVGESEGDRVQRVDLWFVAYGTLDEVTDEDLLGQLVGGSRSEKGESEHLTQEELDARDLKVESSENRRESYDRIDAPLLEKVRISGISHGMTVRSEKTILAASLLDPRFIDDADYPNRWRPVIRNASGKASVGKPQPYVGFGGYCQTVALAKPAGALFIECHMAINEPHGWFNGTNLLRSKLPVLMQDNVRSLRRKLAK